MVTVAVTKGASPDQIRALVELGHADLGENRVQQLEQRVAMMEEFQARRRMMGGGPAQLAEPRWHMIGHLQRNKVRVALPLVKLIHGVDSLRLAEEIQEEAIKLGRDADVLLQVNVSGEASKFGLIPAAVPYFAEQVHTMLNVRVRGLMTMAPETGDAEAARPVFQRCAELFHEMRSGGVYGEPFNLLSMGMSNDFEPAIECGANVVRIGRAIFGETPEA